MVTSAMLVGLMALGGVGPHPSEDDPAKVFTPGSRLRLRVAGEAQPVVGKVVSEDAQVLVLKVSSKQTREMTFELDAIEAMEVSRPRTGLGVAAGILAGAAAMAVLSVHDESSAVGSAAFGGALLAVPGAAVGASLARGGGGVVKGALVGAGTSAVLWGGVMLLLASADDEEDVAAWTRAAVAVGAGFGALSGGVAAAVGQERWQPVPERKLRMSVRPTRGGGIAASVQLSF
jgi:hypothetical protein